LAEALDTIINSERWTQIILALSGGLFPAPFFQFPTQNRNSSSLVPQAGDELTNIFPIGGGITLFILSVNIFRKPVECAGYTKRMRSDIWPACHPNEKWAKLK
jgi:hypothetical protein